MSGFKKNYGISLARLVATILVFVSHYYQYYGNRIAFYAGVGVQVFLTMSGYLNCRCTINSSRTFLKKRLIRLLIPYYLWVFVIITVNYFQHIHMDRLHLISAILCLQWLWKTLPNGGHLWYITCILLCYLVTPLLYRFSLINVYWLTSNTRKFCILMLFVVVICLHCVGLLPNSLIMIEIYCFGYLTGINEKDSTNHFPKICDSSAIITLVLVFLFSVMYCFETYCGVKWPEWFFLYYKGVLSVLLFSFLTKFEIRSLHVRSILDFTDRYSFEFYLVHHMFILGALRPVLLVPFGSMYIIVAIVCSVILAMLLNRMEYSVRRIIDRR